jgi:hypothetical protein
MVEALYDEMAPEDRRQLENHLDECEACAQEFAELQDTLGVMAQRERPELPEAYWDSYRRRLDERRAGDSRSLNDRVRQWWQSLPVLLPKTGGQWAVQGAVAVALLAVGLWSGLQLRPTGAPSQMGGENPTAVPTLLPIADPTSVHVGQPSPVLRGVDDITFDVEAETVAIRYRTANRITVRGQPDDPTIQRLLRAALLDTSNPASQLHAMKTLEQSALAPSEDLVRALTYLVRKEQNPNLQLRALRSLRALYRNASMAADTRSVLVNLLLDTEAPEATRVEALQTLMATSSTPDPSLLYPVRDDSNAYLRYEARSALQNAQSLDVDHLQN